MDDASTMRFFYEMSDFKNDGGILDGTTERKGGLLTVQWSRKF
jgi:hypothetical protein